MIDITWLVIAGIGGISCVAIGYVWGYNDRSRKHR